MLQAVVAEIWYNIRIVNMCMLDEIRAKRDEIYAIARKHKAEKLWVFGSCARKEERPDSDVDFIAAFADNASLMNHAGLEWSLSNIVGCPVDVVSSMVLGEDTPFSVSARKDMVAL